MQGIFILADNGTFQRPKSKKQIKELVAAGRLDAVQVEATSLFGKEHNGPLSTAPKGTTITFCGPDPYNKRSFYGTIALRFDGKVVVK